MYFNEETHEYFEGDKKLISVTQLLRKFGITEDYSGVADAVLKLASERGNAIHKEIETYLTTGVLGFSKAVERFSNWAKENIKLVIGVEKIVSNDIVAGRYDLFVELMNGQKARFDIKTTYKVNKVGVAYQLGCYNELDEIKDDVEGVIHFDNDDNMSIMFFDKIESWKIENLFEAERGNAKLEQNNFELRNKEDIDKLIDLLKQKELIETEISYLKEKLQKDNELKQGFKNDKLTISYVLPSVKVNTVFNEEEFKMENEELYKKYSKEQVKETAGQFKYILKKEKK